jgi:hypothetical protein
VLYLVCNDFTSRNQHANTASGTVLAFSPSKQLGSLDNLTRAVMILPVSFHG